MLHFSFSTVVCLPEIIECRPHVRKPPTRWADDVVVVSDILTSGYRWRVGGVVSSSDDNLPSQSSFPQRAFRLIQTVCLVASPLAAPFSIENPCKYNSQLKSIQMLIFYSIHMLKYLSLQPFKCVVYYTARLQNTSSSHILRSRSYFSFLSMTKIV